MSARAAPPWRRRWLKPVATLLLTGLVLTSVPVERGEGQDLVADLSKHLVAITTGFTGTEVLLFGAVERPAEGGPPGEVAVVVRGPSHAGDDAPKVARRGDLDEYRVDDLRAGAQLLCDRRECPAQPDRHPQVRQRNGIGLDALNISLPPAKASPNVAREWRDALIRAKQRNGLYTGTVRPVVFLGARLFRTEVYFPANVPTGSYQVETYLLRDGQVVSAQTTPLIVSKVGVEATLTRFAYEHAAVYGLVAIIVALLAGWGGYALFRKGLTAVPIRADR